ncbi:GspE/PulE family protein [Egicoccus halophilus]|uniref:Type II secretion system protein E n=1 Tax=Egicoccus halophilus TaxID=1670830 RepID=A0A8J3EYZ5_9ACTN|nr:GspE/PulE family protein [Egicoccus halophilus]GGI08835.1 type II secretion system protein E [Egicoccus halophilus]
MSTDLPASVPDAAAAPGWRRLRIGEVLVEAGALTADQVAHALHRKEPDERLGDTVVRLGMCTEADVADAVASRLNLPRVDVLVTRPTREALDQVPVELAEQFGLLPLSFDGGTLVVATADPNLERLDDLRILTRARHVQPVIAATSALRLARRQAYRAELSLSDQANAPEREEADGSASESSPVVQFVESLVSEALVARASDLHLEPDVDGLRVRMRVDGLLRDVTRVPAQIRGQVLSRIKIMAQLDIAERRLPQDGRALVRTGAGDVDLRVATMPTMHGEKGVLRLLARGTDRVTIGELGMHADVRGGFVEALARPQGLVLVTGPTGSGKTTTLYAGLAAITDETRNIVTLEDPIEYELPGINQTQVNPRIGFTFARGLRHILRQDPDVVLVGEIRDQETAQLAVEAATTGHLVLATLHTNDAPSSVARLIDLGADRFLVCSSLLQVLGQRLARKICTGCPVVDEPTDEVLRRLGIPRAALETASPRRGAGCPACEYTGELGRVSVTELLRMTPALRHLLAGDVTEHQIAVVGRREGMRPLREDALTRAWRGEITFAEVLRTTPEPTATRADAQVA